MQNIFANIVKEKTPELNPNIMNGLACSYIAKVLDYIDLVFKSASKSFPEGLIYLGYERCTPLEEFEEVTRIKNSKRQYDLARSDIFMVKYYLRFNGVDLPPRFIYLPFLNEAGIMYIGGACFHIIPVLSDKVISPGFDNVFVKLLRDKLIFKRVYHSLIVDGQRVMVQVIWSSIYRKPKDNSKVPITTKALTTPVHYLFAKYGVIGTFKKYCNFVPVFGNEEINTDTYPPDKWMIIESNKLKPKTYKGMYYDPNTIKIAIPKDKWGELTQALISGFYYIVDHFPSRIKVAYLDNTKLWMILLGCIIFSGNFSEGKLYANMEEHFISLSEYVDSLVIDKLKESNYFINDFYDLLVLLLAEFNNILLHTNGSGNSVYNKNFEILYYTLYDVTAGIFRTNFKLNKTASKKQLTYKEVLDTLTKQMKTGAIFSLSSGKAISSSVSYSGDHKYPKITALVVEQENVTSTSSSKKNKGHKAITEKHRIHTSMVEVGSLLFIPKNNPTPVVRVNPFVHVDIATGSIVRNQALVELLDKTQNILSNINKGNVVEESLEVDDKVDLGF